MNKLLRLSSERVQFGTTTSQTVGQLLALYKDKAINETSLREGLNLLQTNVNTNNSSSVVNNAIVPTMEIGNQNFDRGPGE